MFEKIGSTFKTANNALAEAQKAWRADDISAREASLAQRETQLRQEIAVFNAQRRKAWFGRAVFGLVSVVLALAAFGLGVTVGGLDAAETEVSAATADPEQPTANHAPSNSSDGEIASDAADSALPTFLQCVSNGEAYFKEIGAWPTLTTTGEDAPSVVRERCGRSRLAFGDN